MKGFNELTIESLKAELEKGDTKPLEILERARMRVENVEPALHALNRTTIDDAVDRLKAHSKINQPFHGIPCVIKDNICTSGVPTNCSSKILDGFVPPYTSTADARITDAGFAMIGKSNMDEFGMGSSTEYSAWGPTFNPYDLSRVPGGSSGGSAAAVAAGYAAFALGSDTGGSIRQPAAFCGCVGLRPTYGRVSRYGLVMFASSLDQIGPITTTVRGSAQVLSLIQGTDGRDSTLVDIPVENYLAHIEEGIKDLRVGVLDVSFADWVDERVKSVFSKNLDWFRDRAKTVKEVKIKSFDTLLAAYYTLAPAEASSNLARYDGIRYGQTVDFAEPGKDIDENTARDLPDYYRKNRTHGFGTEVIRRILIGTFVLSRGYYESYYLRAQKVRARLRAELDELWKEVDIIINPTTPTPPFKIGWAMNDPMDMYQADRFVLLQSMAGAPGISINGGWTDLDDDHVTKLEKSREKNCFGKPATVLPIGLHITTPPFAEAVLFRAARAFEREHT